LSELAPICEYRLEKPKRTDDIGLDKLCRRSNGPIDMGFGCQMDNGIDCLFPESDGDSVCLSDIYAFETVSWMTADGGKRK
jgi:hypothetical protein